MHTSSSVQIHAPREKIFEVTSNLENWTPMLPHYRYINFLERDGDEATVVMACYRGSIPLSWTSRHEIDREKMEMTFTHLKKFTKGMVVVWTYEETANDGVKVSIIHDLKFRVRFLAPLAEYIIGTHFIDPVARKTLATFKELLEKEEQPS